MKFAIITHVEHLKENNQYYGYAPYVREINIWIKHVDEVIVVAPIVDKPTNAIHIAYTAKRIHFRAVSTFNITSFKAIVNSFIKLPSIIFTIFKAMKEADHIHLRCPGNMGLLGALIQIVFPSKKKTAKYAGNWDPKAKQPFTYKLQRWILSNTFLTKKMQVLVYGEWPDQSKNVKSFFTATYSEKEIQNSEFRIQNKVFKNEVQFLFVGTLSQSKQPLYALYMVHELVKRGYNAVIYFYGEGNQRTVLEAYIQNHKLENRAVLKGNQTKEVVEEAYKASHFLLLPSKSEGWPKVVAEAMFWGCVPIVSSVSCVPYMLDYGNRGILLQNDLTINVNSIERFLKGEKSIDDYSKRSLQWSRRFTLDFFEEEIKKLL
jgi:glycosyltransferase involved in cell wall biosynthesis